MRVRADNLRVEMGRNADWMILYSWPQMSFGFFNVLNQRMRNNHSHQARSIAYTFEFYYHICKTGAQQIMNRCATSDSIEREVFDTLCP